MEKFKLYRIYDIKEDGNTVLSAKKELIAEITNKEDAVNYVDDYDELYIMRFDEHDNLMGIAGMVYGGFVVDEDDECYDELCNGYVSPFIDVAEWDYRVVASVAFNVDLMRGNARQ